MPIETGPYSHRRNKLLITGVICLALAGWFAYDGWISYPRDLQQEIAGRAELAPGATLIPNPRVTQSLAGKSAAEIERIVGSPPPYRSPGEVRFFGEGGDLSIPTADNRAKWNPYRHSPADILMQKVLAGITVVLGAGAMVKFLKVNRSRLVLDDVGLRRSDGWSVAWAQMKALRSDDYEKKGWVDLEYADAAGKTNTWRIDSYHWQEFDAVVNEICRRREFPNPLPAARSEAGAG